MSDAIRAIGIQLQRGDGADPEVFTAVAEVLDIQGPGMSADLIDVTNQDSAGSYREFIAGAKDGGEVTFNINYIPTNATHDATSGLLEAFDTGSQDNWKLIWPDAAPSTEWTFTGVITAFQPSANIDEQLQASITLKVIGQPTLA